MQCRLAGGPADRSLAVLCMITNRHRGLVRIHGAALLLGVAVFFWVYAEITIRYLSGWMKLSREVNLRLYFLCVVIGMLAASGRIRAAQARLTRLSGVEAAGLATAQVTLMALAVFSMMFATQDRSISRLFLGTFLLWSWLGLFWLHRVLPRKLAGFLYGQGASVPTLFIGRAETLPQLQEWLAQRTHLGVLPAGFVSLSPEGKPETVPLLAATNPVSVPAVAGQRDLKLEGLEPDSGFRSQPSGLNLAPLSELPRVLEEKGIGQVILMELPASEPVARQIIDHCQAHGCRLLIHHRVDEILGHPVVSLDEGGHHFFTLHEEPLEEPLNRALKRGFDLAVALPAVVLILPWLVALVWVMQRLQAPGPLFHARAALGRAARAVLDAEVPLHAGCAGG